MPALIPRQLRTASLTWWLVTAVVSAATGLLVIQSLSVTQAAAQRMGNMVSVPVAARSIAPGETIGESDFINQQLPSSMLPTSPVLKNPVGSVATTHILNNEPLVEAKVGSGSLSPTSALLAPGELGVAVAASTSTPAVRVGDYVDVLSVFTSNSSDRTGGTALSSARVISVNEKSVTIAVQSRRAAAIAALGASGNAVIALARPEQARSEQVDSEQADSEQEQRP